MQVILKKSLNQASSSALRVNTSFMDVNTVQVTDAESLASTEFQPIDVADSGKLPCSRIGTDLIFWNILISILTSSTTLID